MTFSFQLRRLTPFPKWPDKRLPPPTFCAPCEMRPQGKSFSVATACSLRWHFTDGFSHEIRPVTGVALLRRPPSPPPVDGDDAVSARSRPFLSALRICSILVLAGTLFQFLLPFFSSSVVVGRYVTPLAFTTNPGGYPAVLRLPCLLYYLVAVFPLRSARLFSPKKPL